MPVFIEASSEHILRQEHLETQLSEINQQILEMRQQQAELGQNIKDLEAAVEKQKAEIQQRILNETPCAVCGGTGLCKQCGGRKKIRCQSCSGTGRGHQVQDQTTCPSCKGQGTYVSAFGTRVPCSQCGRSGYIKGSKINPCIKCSGRGYISCPVCSGWGKCKACGGAGTEAARTRTY